jgi:hypothetical protein
MGAPILVNYPRAPELDVLDALRSVLRDDPTILLADPHLTLLLREGDDTDEDHPPYSRLPAVRLGVGGYPSGTYTENAMKGTIRFVLDCFSPGLHYDDAWKVLHLVRQAIWTQQDPARAAVLKGRYAVPGWVFATPRIAGEFRVELPEGRWARRTVLALDATFILGTI